LVAAVADGAVAESIELAKLFDVEAISCGDARVRSYRLKVSNASLRDIPSSLTLVPGALTWAGTIVSARF
jgi:hypothetical protein